MRPIRFDNHPFPFLLYGEWMLMAIALISEFSPSVLPRSGGFPWLCPAGKFWGLAHWDSGCQPIHLGSQNCPCRSTVWPVSHRCAVKHGGPAVVSAVANRSGHAELPHVWPLGTLAGDRCHVYLLLQCGAASVGRFRAIAALALKWTTVTQLIGVRLSLMVMFLVLLVFLLLFMNALLSERQRREELRLANQRLRESAAQIEKLAMNQERTRIAREIHDSLGHALTGLNIQLEGALKLWDANPEQARTFVAQAKEMGSTALHEARQAVATLRQTPLAQQDLAGGDRPPHPTTPAGDGGYPHCVGRLSPLTRIFEANGLSHRAGSPHQHLQICSGDSSQHYDPALARWGRVADHHSGQRGGVRPARQHDGLWPARHSRTSRGGRGADAVDHRSRPGLHGASLVTLTFGGGMIHVLLVDDQAIVRQGLKALLSLEADLEIVGEAANGREAVAIAQKLLTTSNAVDVALMDIRMPVMDGVAATRELLRQYPDLKVLVLTTFEDDDLVQQAVQAGAVGYLLKDTPSEEVAQAIRAVHRGYAQFGPGILQKMVVAQPAPQKPEIPPGFDELTPREREVLALIGQGANNREIAQALFLSEGTVKNHVTNILGRLGLRDRTQAALLAASLPSEND
jgi:DNA-binding NarL/FixJ family response regulator/uncharacterized membrane protein